MRVGRLPLFSFIYQPGKLFAEPSAVGKEKRRMIFIDNFFKLFNQGGPPGLIFQSFPGIFYEVDTDLKCFTFRRLKNGYLARFIAAGAGFQPITADKSGNSF
ncbi:hypothetical protein ES705_42975 [subsurface metagenome]